jgi:tetratricopeptide (TPR) repeat protein
LSLTFFTPLRAQDWKFNETQQKAYSLALNLQTSESLQLIPSPRSAQEIYITSLAQALELLVTEDKEKFELYERAYEKLLRQKSTSPEEEELFLKAEMRLQWMVVYLKFGHELDAALNLRECYRLVQACKKISPGFIPILKTSGVLEVLIGSVPEKYTWILDLFNMEGSVDTGLQELESISKPGISLYAEAVMLHSFIEAFALQHTESALKKLTGLQSDYPENKLVFFLGAATAIKNSDSEKAIAMLSMCEKVDPRAHLSYAYYLRGEAYLHKADYPASISAYHKFLQLYKGQNYIKDAHYKIGMCHWLSGNPVLARKAFNEARSAGTEASEADRYAARSLAETDTPNISLTKARYYTDGGYYKEADLLLQAIDPEDMPVTRDQIEYHYRQARLAHKTGKFSDAKLSYQKVIETSLEDALYFAPSACLQLGYIFMNEGNKSMAGNYFKMALSYRQHPYKNSIDSKAKSALAQLKTRK